jgi:transposase
MATGMGSSAVSPCSVSICRRWARPLALSSMRASSSKVPVLSTMTTSRWSPAQSASTRQSSLRAQALIVGGRRADAGARQRDRDGGGQDEASPAPTAAHEIVGRNRSIVTDTLGLLLAVLVTAASVQDSVVGTHLVDQVAAVHPPLPRRWTVERTYGWLMSHRHLAREYETLPARSEAMIHLAMTGLMARRLTDEATISWSDPTPRDQTAIPG